MVHFQWNSKVQRSNAIRFTAKQTIDDTSRSGPGRTIIGDFGIHFEVNKMRNYSGAAMAPLKVSLVSGVRSMRLHLSLLFSVLILPLTLVGKLLVRTSLSQLMDASLLFFC